MLKIILCRCSYFYLCSVRALTILLLFIFLNAGTAFGELLRLPVLVHHYMEHRHLDHQSLVDFLNEHYANKINHPDDSHHDHKKLPFKTACHAAQLLTLAAPLSSLSVSKILSVTAKPVKAGYSQEHYSNAYLNSIWQPPRFS